jgi:hypothetical protein
MSSACFKKWAFQTLDMPFQRNIIITNYGQLAVRASLLFGYVVRGRFFFAFIEARLADLLLAP